jgi:hypothetical protein
MYPSGPKPPDTIRTKERLLQFSIFSAFTLTYPIHFTPFSSKKAKKQLATAGLLTYKSMTNTFPNVFGQWLLVCHHERNAYSSGTVQDFHLIPFLITDMNQLQLQR